MTLNEIIYSISHTLNKHDDHFFLEKIKEDVINYRALYLRRDLSRNLMSTEFQQKLACIELECVDISECCNLESGVSVLRSVRKIPKPLRAKSTMFHYVGSTDMGMSKNTISTMPYEETSSDMYQFTMHNQFTAKTTKYAYANEYLYIFNPPSLNLKYITVIGTFADPREAAKFINCDGDPCYTDDDEFPCPEDMLAMIQKDILNIYQIQHPVIDDEVDINTEEEENLIRNAKN